LKIFQDLVKVALTDSQKNAVESFVNDRGVTAFKNSNLLKMINRGEFEQAAEEFGRWCVANGKFSEELAALRQKEVELFTKTH
jgi:lysozyme